MRHILCLLFLLLTAVHAATVDLDLPHDKALLVITSQASPAVPWGYATIISAPIQPGDTVRIPSGNYNHLLFWELQGTEDAPIRIINHGGPVVCDNDFTWSAITLRSCQHVHFTGTGDDSIRYGFRARCNRAGVHSVNISGQTSHIEVDHVEVFGAGFAGFNVKNEVSPDLHRGNYLMTGIHLHHNFVHSTGGEGMYIGHTYESREIDGQTYYTHFLNDITVEYNRLENTGAEAIQVGNTPSGLLVRHNAIANPGMDPFANFQNNGIQIGACEGLVLGNTITDAAGNGIIYLGSGHVAIVANLIIRSGANGMFVDDRPASPEAIARGHLPLADAFKIINNTIIDPGQDSALPDSQRCGIRLYGADLPRNYVWNNVIIGGVNEQNAVSPLNNNMPLNEQANMWFAEVDGLFRNADQGDFVPGIGSPLVNTGHNVETVSESTWTDARGRARPAAAIDVGAFEFRYRSVSLPSHQRWRHQDMHADDGLFVGLDGEQDHVFNVAPTNNM